MNLHACRTPGLLPALIASLIAVGADGHHASAQAPAPPAAKKDDDRARRLDEMKQVAGSFRAVAIDGGPRAPATMVREPLYRWNDPTREFSDGTLWFWKASGRPIAVLATELYPNNNAFGTVWALEFTSLSTGPIEVEGGEHFDAVYADLYPPRADGSLRWAPAKGGVAFREVADAPVPAKTESERLRQMRDIMKRFSAREFFHSQTYTLRPIPRPIDRFADEASGLMDGAIFLYASGTNPEVLLMLEARRRRDGSSAWFYAGAPFARAEVTLRLDGKDVWSYKCKEVPSPEDIYFLRVGAATRRVATDHRRSPPAPLASHMRFLPPVQPDRQDVAYVPEPNMIIASGCAERSTIGGECHFGQPRGLTIQTGELLAGRDPPKPDHPVIARRRHRPRIRGKADRDRAEGMPLELAP